MDRTKTLANPLRSDVTWQWNLVQGLVALGIGLYILLAEDSARRDIVLVIGIFLLVNGLVYAMDGLQSRSASGTLAQFRLIRAGIGIATGLIVVLNRFMDFMSLDAARVVAGIGLVGIGVVTLVGLVMAREETGVRIGALLSAALLIAWGTVILYQSTTNSNVTSWLGWIATLAGVAILVLAWYRRQSSITRTSAARA